MSNDQEYTAMQAPNNHKLSDKVDQVSATYDEMFSGGGVDSVFGLPYRHSCYFPMYKAVAAELIHSKATKVLEVGCGTGAMAHMLFDRGNWQYRGFDFSHVAVEKAIQRTGVNDAFYVSDALDTANYVGMNGDVIICTEVLEHIPNDLALVAKWPKGTRCVCSVPNFDSRYHERFFQRKEDVLERYGELIAIDTLREIKKPILEDISISNVFRQLRWNRYRPKRFLEILGLGKFSEVGGWFIFSGERR